MNKKIKHLDGIIEVLQSIKKEIKELYGINLSTLSRQSSGQYGLPLNIVERNSKNKNDGIILNNIVGTRYQSMLKNRQGKENDRKNNLGFQDNRKDTSR